MNSPALIRVGHVARTHGVRGAIVIFSPLGKDSALSGLGGVSIGTSETTAQPFTIKEAAWMPSGWKVELHETTTFETAQALKDRVVFAARTDLPALAEGQFYVDDLVGFEVIDEKGTSIGRFTGTESLKIHDLWLIHTESGIDSRVLTIPAVRHFIDRIDTSRRIIQVQHLDELP